MKRWKNAPDPYGPDSQVEFLRHVRRRKLKPKEPKQLALPNVDWKFYLPNVCPTCNGLGRHKRDRICQNCNGNCFIPNARTLPEEEHQLEIENTDKWTSTKFRVKAFDKVAQGHFASASFEKEEDATGFAQILKECAGRFTLIRIEAVKEKML